MTESKNVTIRTLKGEDMPALVEIDKKVLGQERSEYWQMKLELLECKSPIGSLVAERDGKVVGFVLGDASGWEFGISTRVGWIDTIGVDPDYQHSGIARQLIREMVNNLKKVGVGTVYTFVDWRNRDMLKFFDKIGFGRGNMINLEMKIE